MRKIFVVGESVSGSGRGAAFALGGERICVQTVLGLYEVASWLAELLASMCGPSAVAAAVGGGAEKEAEGGTPALRFAPECNTAAVSNALRGELVETGLAFMRNGMVSLRLLGREQALLEEAHDVSVQAVLGACDRLDRYAPTQDGGLRGERRGPEIEAEESDSEIEVLDAEEDCWL